MSNTLTVYSAKNGFVVRNQFEPGMSGTEHVFETAEGLAEHMRGWGKEIEAEREPVDDSYRRMADRMSGA